METADISNIRVPVSVLSDSPSPLSSPSGHMSPKMKRISSLACSSLEAPWSELWRMSEAKRALMEVGHVALACSGSVGPIIALHSSTAFSLFRMSIIQGPLVGHTHLEEQYLHSIHRNVYQSFLIHHLAHSICTVPIHSLGCVGCFVNICTYSFFIMLFSYLAIECENLTLHQRYNSFS